MEVRINREGGAAAPLERGEKGLGSGKVIAFAALLCSEGKAARNNCIGMSFRDLKVLFGNIPSDRGDRFIKIGRFVFRAMPKKWLSPGRILLNESQKSNLSPERFYLGFHECLLVSRADMAKGRYPDLKKLFFEVFPIYPESSQQEKSPLKLEVNKLKKSLIKLWNGDPLTVGQLLFFVQEQARMNLKIAAMNAEEACRFGRLSEKTEFEFRADTSSGISLVENQTGIKLLHLACTICRVEPLSEELELPLVVSEHWLKRSCRDKLAESWFAKGETFTLEDSKGYRLHLKISEIKVCGKERAPSSPPYIRRYRFEQNASPKFAFPVLPDVELLVSQGLPKESREMRFKILRKKDSPVQVHLGNLSKNWLIADELKAILKNGKKIYVCGEKRRVELSSGAFEIELAEVLDGKGEKSLEKAKHKQVWHLTERSNIKLQAAASSGIELIADRSLNPLKSIEFEVEPASLNSCSELVPASVEELEALVRRSSEGEARLIKGESRTFELSSGHSVRLTVSRLKFLDGNCASRRYSRFGKLDKTTSIQFKNTLKNHLYLEEKPEELCIRDPIRFLEQHGLGGLSEEAKLVIESLLLPYGPAGKEFHARGSQTIRGLLLYGKPGTGKSTLAHLIGRMLGGNVKEISGTELYSKFVGESEEKVRDLFRPAVLVAERLKKKKIPFLLIIDEIDALLPSRGDVSTRGWQKSVVSEFLSQWDGLTKHENVIVIGTSNYKEGIDSAALRPGRFDEKLEIGAPDQKGRKKIFEIYLKRLQRAQALSAEVSVEKLARETEGCTGAEIQALVKYADKLSLLRLAAPQLEFLERKALFAASCPQLSESEKCLLASMTEGYTRDDFKRLFALGYKRLSSLKEEISKRSRDRKKVGLEDFRLAMEHFREKSREEEIVRRYFA